MFISKQEKTDLRMRIEFLEGRLAYCLREIDDMSAAIKNLTALKKEVKLQVAKAKRNAYAREYYHRVVKPKKAQEPA